MEKSKATQVFTEAGDQLMGDLPSLLIRILLAVGLALLGLLVIRLGRKLINRVYNRAQKDKPLTANMRTAHTLIRSIFDVVMYFAIAATVLAMLGVNVGSLLAVAGISGFAITFGCQTLIKDYISGIFLWLEGRIAVGDVVTVAGVTGRVENMALRTTSLRGLNGHLFTVPNGDIRTVVNMNRDYRTAMVDVTVAHGQDYSGALRSLQQAMDELRDSAKLEDAPQVEGITGMDGRAATVHIVCRCETEKCWALEREMRLAALEKMAKDGYKV